MNTIEPIEETATCYSCQYSATLSRRLCCTADGNARQLLRTDPCDEYKEITERGLAK